MQNEQIKAAVEKIEMRKSELLAAMKTVPYTKEGEANGNAMFSDRVGQETEGNFRN